MNEKDLYKLFNNVKIEEDEFDDIGEEVSDMQKKRIKKNLNKKIKSKRNWKLIKYSSTAAALGLACLIGINTVSPAFAENIPVIGSIVQTLNEKMGIYGDYAEYSQIVDKSITNKGITVRINEVMADGSRLIIGYTVESDKKLVDEEWGEFFSLTSDFKINGKRISGRGSSMGDYIDDYTYIGSRTVDISRLEIPEEFNINFKISNIMDIKGKWNFAFSASKEEISKNTTVFKPNKEIDFPDSTINIDKVEFSPIGTYISLSGDYKVKPGEFEEPGIFEYDYWLAYDDKGVELTSNGLGGGTSGGDEPKDFYSEMQYAKVDEIPEYLNIIPLKIIPSGGGGVSFDGDTEMPIEIETKEPIEVREPIDGIYPKELNQGKFGKLIINDIKTMDNKTTVNLTAEGKAANFQAENLDIVDEQGEFIRIKNFSIEKGNKNLNEFTVEFEALDPNSKYYLRTTEFDNIEFYEDMKFKIELKK